MRVIVVGASSGIGAALMGSLVAQGHMVCGAARREDRLRALCDELGERASYVVNDATATETVPAAFATAAQQLGGVDAVIYSSGVMPDVSIDEYDDAKDRHIIEVNVIGGMAWLNAAARHLSAQGSGMIVGIGSVAGDRGRVGNPAYCASKACLHAYLEALRNRLGRKGVHVLTVKPGPVHSEMTQGKPDAPLIVDASVCAEAIVRAMNSHRLQLYVPFAWWPIMTVVRNIPSVIFRRLSI